MDPCPFVRIRVGNLSLKHPTTQPTSSPSTSATTTTTTTLNQQPVLPTTTTTTTGSVPTSHHSPAPFFYCKIKFANFPSQTAAIPLSPPDSPAAATATASSPSASAADSAACFSLSKADLDKLRAGESKTKTKTKKSSGGQCLKVDVYCRKRGGCGGFGWSGKFTGRVSVAVAGADLGLGLERSVLVHTGWVTLGREGKGGGGGLPQLYLSVKLDPDPRFVFEFGGEPECSPQVFQVKGSVAKQPVFTCKFGFRNSGEWNARSSSVVPEPSTSTSCWVTPIKDHSSHNNPKNQLKNERKGWTVTIHDLSGSPIAAASMVTPFVPSPGSDQVSRSNPGAWLILRPGDGIWKPWGRLEAWRDRSHSGSHFLGHRFEIIPDTTSPSAPAPAPTGYNGVSFSNGSDISTKKGGKFTIDIGAYNSPVTSPSSSFDLGSWCGSGSAGSASGSGSDSGSGGGGGALLWWPQFMYRGFVMSTTLVGESQTGKGPEVEVGVQHVACAEDAAVFVALAAAMDLSMDACLPFSKKLRKELRQERAGEIVV